MFNISISIFMKTRLSSYTFDVTKNDHNKVVKYHKLPMKEKQIKKRKPLYNKQKKFYLVHFLYDYITQHKNSICTSSQRKRKQTIIKTFLGFKLFHPLIFL